MGKTKSSIFWVGFWRSLGWLLALIGLFYDCSDNSDSQLTFFINPTRVPLVVEDSEFVKVYVRDSLIKSEVNLVRIGFWNSGGEEIRKEDIRQALKFQFDNDAVVLSASIIAKSSEFLVVSLDSNELKNNSVIVSWDILENMEGGAIDVEYIGNLESKISVSGQMVGQKNLSQLDYNSGQSNTDTVVGRLFSRRSFSMILEMVILISMLALSSKKGSLLDKYCKALFGSKYKKSRKEFSILLFIILTISFIYNCYSISTQIPDFSL